MTTVQRWTGREARALRLALRLSVRAFAAALGVGVRTVASWEADGAHLQPRPEMQAVLDTALRRADDEAKHRFRLLLYPELADTATRHEERQRQADAANQSHRVPVSEETADELRARLASAGAVDQQALALLAGQIDHIRQVDRMLGARAAEPQLRGHLTTLRSLRSYTIGRRDALADLYADAATLAG
jgi:transcriptional regulator with XRE-family HTH domain